MQPAKKAKSGKSVPLAIKLELEPEEKRYVVCPTHLCAIVLTTCVCVRGVTNEDTDRADYECHSSLTSVGAHRLGVSCCNAHSLITFELKTIPVEADPDSTVRTPYHVLTAIFFFLPDCALC